MPARRYYHLADANAALPELRRLFARIFQVRPQLAASYRALDAAGHTPGRGDFEGEDEECLDVSELDSAMLREYGRFRALAETLRADISEVEAHGCAIKDLASGLVDWLALSGDRPVLLCWRFGEAEVGFFHELDDGFAGRRPVEELE